jgi:hypothetical protein
MKNVQFSTLLAAVLVVLHSDRAYIWQRKTTTGGATKNELFAR